MIKIFGSQNNIVWNRNVAALWCNPLTLKLMEVKVDGG